MTQYAWITDGAVVGVYDLTPEQYAEFQVNGKAAHLRLWVVDPQPTPTATQLVVFGTVAITATEARQTWVLRNKTQVELDIEANEAELALMKQAITALTTDIQAYNPTPDTTGTTAQLLAKLNDRLKDVERQQQRSNRIHRALLKKLLP